MKNDEKLVIAGVSATSYPGEVEKNTENILKWTKEAKKQNVDFLLFPEMSLSGYWLSSEMHYKAEPLDGPNLLKLSEDIIDIGDITISVGFAEAKSNTIYNTQIILGPEGIVGYYRKTHYPFPENKLWTVGNHFPIHDVGNFKIGTAICADNSFPEVHRIYGILGADICLLPYAFGFIPFTPGDKETEQKAILGWKQAIKSRTSYASQTNTFYSVVCVGAGNIKDYRAARGEKPGFSVMSDRPEEYWLAGVVFICDSWGRIIAESPDDKIDEYLIKAEVEREVLIKSRGYVYSSLKDRRPQIYKILTDLP